jgi:hypothetical protein
MADMNHEGIFVSERIGEIMMMCARENPIYEQVSNYSIALYVIGHLRCADVMTLEDIEITEAASILKEHFVRISEKELPSGYDIRESEERFILVIGDPSFPEHFAALVNSESDRPYFSKLKFFGGGFDSLEELKEEFVGKNGVSERDLAVYRQIPRLPASVHRDKIFTIKDDGSYSVFELNRQLEQRR